MLKSLDLFVIFVCTIGVYWLFELIFGVIVVFSFGFDQEELGHSFDLQFKS